MSYNGWSNWETWIISLYFGDLFADMAGDYTPDEWEAEILQSTVEEMLESENVPTSGSIVAEFVNGCMNSVNWHELADHFAPEEDVDSSIEDAIVEA